MYDPNKPSKLKHYGVIERTKGVYEEVGVLGCTPSGVVLCVVLDALPAHENTDLRKIIESPLAQKQMYLSEHLNTIPFTYRGGHVTWFEEIVRKQQDRQSNNVLLVPLHNVRGLEPEQKAQFSGYGSGTETLREVGAPLTPEREQEIIEKAKEDGLYQPEVVENAQKLNDRENELSEMREMIQMLASNVSELSKAVSDAKKPTRKAAPRKRTPKKATSEA